MRLYCEDLGFGSGFRVVMVPLDDGAILRFCHHLVDKRRIRLKVIVKVGVGVEVRVKVRVEVRVRIRVRVRVRV